MKKDRILQIGLNRVKTLSVDSTASTSKKLKAIFLTELAQLGYRVENPELLNDSVFENFDLIINTLTEMKGGDVNWVPLFPGFPNKVNYNEEVLTLTIEGLAFKFGTLDYFEVIANLIEWDGLVSSRPQTNRELNKGIEDQSSRKSDKHTEWTTLKVSNDIQDVVRGWLANNLYAKSSIKESLKQDIEDLIIHFGLEFLDPSRVTFKEIKSYVMKYLWMKDDYITLPKYIDTPTDILRMFAAIEDGDISLSEDIRFPKLKRKDRKFILSNLEKMPNLADNLNQYKGLWLALGRYIHPGEYRTLYPNSFKAFDALRNGKVTTYNGLLQKAIDSKDLINVLKLASSRPGVFGRRLHEIIDVFSDETGVIREFKKIAEELELKNLLVLEKYFETINSLDYKTVINKKGKVIVFPNDKKGTLSQKRIDKLLDGIRYAINKKSFDNQLDFEDGTKVWIDPELRNYTVPLSLRKQSDGLMNISRGTRIKFDKTKTIRLFNYWKESERRTDFDTSLIEFDKDMNYKGHVSYTALHSDGISHSGDITGAPNGASEFIDVDLNKLKGDVKYLAIQVYKYAGESFSQVEKSYAGWMIRDKVNASRQTFDIKTVQHKFNMVGSGNYAIPMIVDVEAGEIIYIDLYMNGTSSMNRVEGAVNDVSTVARELVRMIDTKPNMLDLVKYRMSTPNITVVEKKEDADVTYGITDCTHSIDRVDEILADLL